MNALSISWSETRVVAPAAAETEVRRRKASLLAILSEGLSTLPSHLFQLDALLSTSPVDLEAVSSVIRSDPNLRTQLLRLCNSTLFGLERPLTSVEEAAILTGAEKLRKLVFACHLIQLSTEQLAEDAVDSFWTHSLVTAMLSERLGGRLSLEDTDQAHLGGLLHDVGKLPLLMVATEENSSAAVWLGRDGGDSLGVEREYFGLDHCEVGRWLGIDWNFSPAVVEVIESHHQPEYARFAPLLVGIVAVADHFCQLMEAGSPDGEIAADDFYRACLPWVNEPGWASLLGLLRREYPLMRKRLENEPAAAAQTETSQTRSIRQNPVQLPGRPWSSAGGTRSRAGGQP